MPTLWTRLRGAVDPYTRRTLGLYTAYPLDCREHIATWNASLGLFRKSITNLGYEPQRLSAAKRHPQTGTLHALSMRRVPDRHPDDAEGTAIAREYDPEQCQYHLHAIEVNGGYDIFSHYELSPSILHPRPNPARLREHYRPTYGSTYLRGVSDLHL